MMKAGCSDVEAAALIRMALEAPPRGATPLEAVAAIGRAMLINPHARHDLLALADLPKEDRQRAQEIAAFQAREMARFNVGYPHCADELYETLRALLKALWPDCHESCLDGAILVGLIEHKSGWTLNPFALVKCMRETSEADRAMRFGHRP